MSCDGCKYFMMCVRRYHKSGRQQKCENFEPDQPHENVAKEAIKEIREMCWGYDIPSPCCPEYREHHEQMQKIIGLCDSWLKKLEEGDPE